MAITIKNYEVLDALLMPRSAAGEAPVITTKNEILRVAVQLGDEEMARWALERGAEPNRDYGMLTPLMIAADCGHSRIVNLLISRGASLNERTGCEETALILACKNAHESSARPLVEAGADLNAGELFKGMTALMFAAYHGQTCIVRLLLEAGADAALKSKDGMTALDFARTASREDAIDLLLSHGG
ncbi:MAG TPA: ankyrin repeat domain-containing protein [Elusimicrobiota bacterium]|nr:ankyrin repeat domain-containing protein [Elusimicrobiota bacterium]